MGDLNGLDIKPKIKQEKRRVSLCVGCGGQIHDQYILRVAPDLEWHAACLKCNDCHRFLDETCTCFVRDGKTYCKQDYIRLFGTKCSKCRTGFSKTDFVMRARNNIYHIDCFRCVACERQLIPGDEFALRDTALLCKADHELVEKNNQGDNNNNNSSSNNNDLESVVNYAMKHSPSDMHVAEDPEPLSTGKSRGSPKGGAGENKTTRVRTVLSEKQLHTLRTCYNANPRPDALMKEQLVEMTGLSPRVIRVWFQNKRCKDKKRAILMKQMQQQDKDGRTMIGRMHGVPMVATSPVNHDSSLSGVQPVEVQAYHPPWKNFTDFALQNDLETLDPGAPAFQNLINQMHGYGASLPPSSEALLMNGDMGGYDPSMGHSDPSPFSQTPSDLASPGSE